MALFFCPYFRFFLQASSFPYLCGMKSRLIFFVSLIVFSCSSTDDDPEISSENDADAARNFIRSALDGRWDDAKNFMLKDSINLQLLESTVERYHRQPKEEKRSYRESTIRFYNTREVSDSISIINYSNTYKNVRDSLKVIRTNGQWLIDLKYSLLASKSGLHVE